ncbi:integrase [Orientia tsutsugamushi]|uniref:Integrase n=2 Tax=Orientia tsutsugamushi TaxID=784 RepID=A0A2U3RU29_ORITS|nr:integrase [Orientia tsutsugamushi]
MQLIYGIIMESITLTLKLTDKLIRKIKIPTERTSTIKDKIEPGLQLRISLTGRKTWSFEKKFRKEGIKELCYKYIEEYAKIYTIYWQKDTARIHNYAKPLFLKKISDIKSNDIEQIFNDISKDGKYATANQFLITLSSIFNKAIKLELIDRNPTLKIDKHKMQARERRLSYDEMSKFLHVLCREATPLIRDFALLALYTGARKSNVLEMEWDNIDFKRKIWHIPKN